MTTEIHDTDDLAMKRAVANHAHALARLIYEGAEHVRELTQAGLSAGGITRAVWAKLEPRETGRMGEETMVDAFAPMLSFLIPMMQDGPEAQRMEQAMSAMRDTVGCHPEFSGVVAGMESAVHRIAVTPTARIKATILRLFAENPSPLPDQAPALECWVTLAGIPMSLQGALSETPEGGLRLMSVMTDQQGNKILHGGKVQMIEQFFCYEEVTSIAVRREVSVSGPRIIQSS